MINIVILRLTSRLKIFGVWVGGGSGSGSVEERQREGVKDVREVGWMRITNIPYMRS